MVSAHYKWFKHDSSVLKLLVCQSDVHSSTPIQMGHHTFLKVLNFQHIVEPGVMHVRSHEKYIRLTLASSVMSNNQGDYIMLHGGDI